MKYITDSYEETEKVAAEFARGLKGGEVIAMYGDLGAGKTAFVRGMARALGIQDHITSPTFTILNVYEGGRLPLYHFDVYRIADPDEMYEIGYEDYIGSDGVAVIEWAELIDDILPDEYLRIDISRDSLDDDDHREISIGRVRRG